MAIVGAIVGLALPTHIIQLSLGGTILAIVVIMLSASKSELPQLEQADSLSTVLRITGIYHEPSMNRVIPWKILFHHHRLHGRKVRVRSGMGKCPSPQSADGSTPENQRCYLKISAFDHRHLSRVDLPQ